MDGPTSSTSHGHPLDPERVAAARAQVPSAEECARVAALLALVADPTRARLLYVLDLVPEMCVGDLTLALGVGEDAVGYGLRVLRTAGLVSRRKEGRVVFYRLAETVPQPLRRDGLRRLLALAPGGDGA